MCRAVFVLAGVLMVSGVAAPATQSQYPKYYNNQWYSKGSGASKYYYSYYYAYYYPSKSRRYVYYYNWQKKQYWGRYDLETDKYSRLPDSKKKENLGDIAEGDFLKPEPLDEVPIPGSDGLKMSAPPKLPD
jgi:hypothetical protein